LPPKSSTYFDLIRAFSLPNCAVCALVDEALLQHIDMFLYENVNNIARREEIRVARGFCSLHATTMASGYGRAQSISLLQQDIVGNVLDDLDKVMNGPAGKSALARPLDLLGSGMRAVAHALQEAMTPRRNCPLCDYERGMETAFVQTLADHITDPEMQSAFEQSWGLCLPHFHMALNAANMNRNRFSKLIEIELNLLHKLKSDLDLYVQKQNTDYVGEPTGPESNAPVRATRITGGRIVHKDGRF
jgi:hypothetical protein